MTILLEANNISYSIKDQSISFRKPEKKKILSSINFKVPEGSITGIVGESGCGKTTLAKIIAGFILPDTGLIKLNFSNDQNNKASIQLLFQNSFEIVNPFRKVNSVLTESLNLGKDPQVELSIGELIRLVEIPENLLDQFCYQISGGERQRVALARILAVNPKILILDEPFSAQDIVSQENLIKLLSKLREKMDLTIICISHNLKILRSFVDTVIVMRNGEIVEKGTSEEIFENSKSEYTKFLMRGEEFNLEIADFEK
jgi:ABC-type glutathione transport system ATPase component